MDEETTVSSSGGNPMTQQGDASAPVAADHRESYLRLYKGQLLLYGITPEQIATALDIQSAVARYRMVETAMEAPTERRGQ